MPFKTNMLMMPRRLNDVIVRINMGEDVYGFELDLLADFVGENFAESL